MKKTIAIVGGSTDPVHNAHVQMAQASSAVCDEVVIVPCGPRDDKQTVNDISPIHRATMIDLALRGKPWIQVDLDDLDRPEFTRNLELQRMYEAKGYEVWHVIGSDLLASMRHEWRNGEELWQYSNFIIFERDGSPIPEELPLHHKLMKSVGKISSSNIRKLVADHEPWEHLVDPAVAEYIKLHKLYRGRTPEFMFKTSLAHLPLAVYVDPFRPEALAEAHRLIPEPARPEAAGAIAVFGGDGTMMEAQQKLWRYRIPFFGVNMGTVGFHLNQLNGLTMRQALAEVELWLCSMLRVEATLMSGEVLVDLAVGDAYAKAISAPEDSRDMTARVNVYVDGKPRIHNLICDGFVTTTAQGSSGYHMSNGCSPFQPGKEHAIGLSAIAPQFSAYRGSKEPVDSVITIENANPDRSKLWAFIDGRKLGLIRSMKVRRSNTGQILLARSNDDYSDKVAFAQYQAAHNLTLAMQLLKNA